MKKEFHPVSGMMNLKSERKNETKAGYLWLVVIISLFVLISWFFPPVRGIANAVSGIFLGLVMIMAFNRINTRIFENGLQNPSFGGTFAFIFVGKLLAAGLLFYGAMKIGVSMLWIGAGIAAGVFYLAYSQGILANHVLESAPTSTIGVSPVGSPQEGVASENSGRRE